MSNKDLVNNNHSYFLSLKLEGINCFKKEEILDLSNGNGNYSPWTIILGDNGTGKTTLLRVLDRMQPIKEIINIKGINETKISPIYCNGEYFSKTHNIEFKLSNIDRIITLKRGGGLAIYGQDYDFFLISYGASRRMSKNPNISQKESTSNKFTSLFDDSIELINAEEWFLQKEMISLKANEKTKIKYKNDFELVKNILIDILPNVYDIRVKEINETNSKLLLEVKINENEWIHIRDLSFGYQTLTALIVDIAANMMEQYPEKENPLEQPVIILIDEIDLHLHPKWQRTVIEKLSTNFPKAQFIATSHSPLIVQAAQDKGANIVVCRKEGDRVIIDNNPDEVEGWRIDQILTSDLFEISSSQSQGIEEIKSEKISILLKNDLSTNDKKRLDFINKKLNTPVFSSKESINAEELIKKAAALLEIK